MRKHLRTAVIALGALSALALAGCENGVLKLPGLGGVDVGGFLASPAPVEGETGADDPRAVAVNTAISSGGVACAGAIMLSGQDVRGDLGDAVRVVKGTLRNNVSVTDLDFAFRGVKEPAFRLAGQLLVQQLVRVFGSTGLIPQGTTGMAMVLGLLDGCTQALAIEPETFKESVDVSISIQLRF